ncbi:MAG: hypothetical protein ACFE9I_12285 [Candidatus Hermodarchaeota archaeon]
MERRKVVKFLEIKGLIYIILSIIEIVLIIIMNFTQFDIDTEPIPLYDFIYSNTLFPLSGTFLWFFLIISMFCFLLLGLYLNQKVVKEDFEDNSLAKLMIVIGMVILLTGFVKMNFLVLLGKTKITTISGTVGFQAAIYDLNITPLFPAVFWILFISINCYILITALIVTGLGIKWTILQKET